MWTDNWGNEYDTKEDAIEGVIENYTDHDNIIVELDCAIRERYLLEWIFENPEVRKHFFRDYAHEIECAKLEYARGCVDEIDEEDE